MNAERFDQWPLPVPLNYQTRLRGAPRADGRPRHLLEHPVTTAVRATATTVVVGCMAVAVPCLVFAGVGWCFDDISTVDAAVIAAGCTTAAAVAAVPAMVCHRRLAVGRSRVRPLHWN